MKNNAIPGLVEPRPNIEPSNESIPWTLPPLPPIGVGKPAIERVLESHEAAASTIPAYTKTAASTWINCETDTEIRNRPWLGRSRSKAIKQSQARASAKWQAAHKDIVSEQRQRWYRRKVVAHWMDERGFTLPIMLPWMKQIGLGYAHHKRSRRQDMIAAYEYVYLNVQHSRCALCHDAARIMEHPVPALNIARTLWRIVCEDCARFVDTGTWHKNREAPRIGTIATRLNDEAQE